MSSAKLQPAEGVKRPWVLFAYDQYYPSGGWGDAHGRFSELPTNAEIQEAVGGLLYDHVRAVNVLTEEIVHYEYDSEGNWSREL